METERIRPKVSVLVPVYRIPEDYLRACVDSLRAQTLKEIEIILVDDGSPDACGAICDQVAEEDARIRVIHQKNAGLCAARNTGFRAASGDWFLFVDGDDYLDADACRQLVLAGEKTGAQVVQFGIVHEFGSHADRFVYPFEDGMVASGPKCRDIQVLLLDFPSNIGDVCGKLIRTDLVKQHDIWHDEELRQGAESLDYNLRLFEHVTVFTFVDRPFYHYRYNGDSISTCYDEKNAEYILKCFRKMNRFVEEKLLAEERNGEEQAAEGIRQAEALREKLRERMTYVIVTTAVSGVFHPKNQDSWNAKKEKMDHFLTDPLVADALWNADLSRVSRLRKIVLNFLRKRWYPLVWMVAQARYRQKEVR